MLIVDFGIITCATGCSFSLPTISNKSVEKTENSSFTPDELEENHLYVWNNDGKTDLRKALGKDEALVFNECPAGDINYEADDDDALSQSTNMVWFLDDADEDIPTLYAGDSLLYVSSTQTPDPIEIVRYADYGYTLGIGNLTTENNNGHYFIPYSDSDETDYTTYIDMNSDAGSVAVFDGIVNLYLDKVGDMQINADSVTQGGTVVGLKRNGEYKCEFYTGSYYQDFKLTANVHAFGYLENYTTYQYDFLHSSCIEIELPGYLKTGYYYINGLGMFRYVSDKDKKAYNGKAYDSNIDWNDPVIKYDDNGELIEDPTATDGDLDAFTGGDAGLSQNKLSVENANQMKQETKTWDYINADSAFIADITLTGNNIGNEEAPVLTVITPEGDEETVNEKEGHFIYQTMSAAVGTYTFRLSNMLDRQFKVDYTVAGQN